MVCECCERAWETEEVSTRSLQQRKAHKVVGNYTHMHCFKTERKGSSCRCVEYGAVGDIFHLNFLRQRGRMYRPLESVAKAQIKGCKQDFMETWGGGRMGIKGNEVEKDTED